MGLLHKDLSKNLLLNSLFSFSSSDSMDHYLLQTLSSQSSQLFLYSIYPMILVKSNTKSTHLFTCSAFYFTDAKGGAGEGREISHNPTDWSAVNSLPPTSAGPILLLNPLLIPWLSLSFSTKALLLRENWSHQYIPRFHFLPSFQ